MRKLIFTFLFFIQNIVLLSGFADTSGICNMLQHYQLLHIANSNNVAEYFAALYASTDSMLDEYSKSSNQVICTFNQKFAPAFANKFIAAVDSFNNKGSIPEIWNKYFSDTLQNPLYYSLIGMNAHINGDMPYVLSETFSLPELRYYRRYYKMLNPAFEKFVKQKIRETVAQNSGVKKYHRKIFGTEILLMKHWVKKWRRRAFRYALKMEKGNRRIPIKIKNKLNKNNLKLSKLSEKVWEK